MMSEQFHAGSKVLNMSAETGSVGLLSWSGGFTLARLTHVTPRRLRLELGLFPEGTGSLRWAVRSWKQLGDQHPKCDLNWCLWLPVRTEAAARMIFADIQAQIRHKRAAGAPAQNARQGARSVTESQLRFLGKTYPRTVALFRALRSGSSQEEEEHYRDELSRAYVEETFACSGVLLDAPKDGEQLLRMARLFAKMSARKRKVDAVEREMIVGCYSKGYCRMTLPQLQEAIREAVGQKLTIDAIRQKWKRLCLPSERSRGRPKATS